MSKTRKKSETLTSALERAMQSDGASFLDALDAMADGKVSDADILIAARSALYNLIVYGTNEAARAGAIRTALEHIGALRTPQRDTSRGLGELTREELLAELKRLKAGTDPV